MGCAFQNLVNCFACSSLVLGCLSVSFGRHQGPEVFKIKILAFRGALVATFGPNSRWGGCAARNVLKTLACRDGLGIEKAVLSLSLIHI